MKITAYKAHGNYLKVSRENLTPIIKIKFYWTIFTVASSLFLILLICSPKLLTITYGELR